MIPFRGLDAPRPDMMVHLCCGPCGTVAWPQLIAEGFRAVGYFYGGNIHPYLEWRRRAQAVQRLADSLSAQAILRPYDPREWLTATAELEDQPEGGRRCGLCFRVQLEAAAQAARERGIAGLCTSLTLSPHKDPQLVNAIGQAIAERYGLSWESRVWRRENGVARSVQESRRLGLYRQNYCGCLFSMRDRFQPTPLPLAFVEGSGSLSA